MRLQTVTVAATLAVVSLATGVAIARDMSAGLSEAQINAALDSAYARFKDLKEGANADYIPALAKVDPNIYGIALVTTDGRVYTKGDVSSEVSIQSISKVFTMAKVIEERGTGAIAQNMGVDATGQVFNSIVAIEQHKGAEMNAMVNPGAITATSMVSGGSRDEIWNKILGYYGDFAGRPLSVNREVFKSESETNQRNQAIAMLMYAYGHIKDDPLRATDIYTEQCSVSVNAKDLATMAATLANGGVNPVTGKMVMKSGDGNGRPVRRLGPVAVQDRAAGEERRRWRHHRRLARQVRHRRDQPAARCSRQQRQGAEDHRGRLQRAWRQSVRRYAGRREKIALTVSCAGFWPARARTVAPGASARGVPPGRCRLRREARISGNTSRSWATRPRARRWDMQAFRSSSAATAA
jgi:glutaminase